MIIKFKRSTLFLLGLVLSTFSVSTVTAEDFLIRDIQVEGEQRIEEGTVLTYLGLNPGDTVSDVRIARAFRNLYKTELFKDIRFDRQGDTLIVKVEERPVIRQVDLEGNKAIKDEDIESSLLQSGVTKGRPLKRNIVEEIEAALQEGYYDQGKYGAKIDATVKDRGNNTVDLKIDVKEGDFSKVKGINIIGNNRFSESELIGELKTKTTNWFSFFRNDDKYSKQQLQGDLETLRSFYINNGHADFNVDSIQVSISPDKKDLFLTVNITEGEIYTFSKGTLINEGEQLDTQLMGRLISALEGEIFSFARLEQISELGKTILGNKGFANAEINPIPNLDKESLTAGFTLLVEPGKKVFVRNIYFEGLDGTEDEVLRRELRFFEGGPLINLERSKYRLQRLPYVKNAELNPVDVQGFDDRVDVKVEIESAQPGDFNFSTGYSSASGLVLGGGFTNTNFFGTGNTVSSNLSISDFTKGGSFSFTDPYYTDNGVSRSYGFSYFKSTALNTQSSRLDTERGSLSLQYGYPLSEYSSIRFGARFSQNELLTSLRGTVQQRSFIENNGDSYSLLNNAIFGTQYQNFELVLGYNYDSRNNFLFASKGTRARISLDGSIPGADVEYYSANFNYQRYFPITKSIYLRNSSDIAFAEEYGDTTILPPTNNFYSGSSTNVRGFKPNWLGPRDSNGSPFGGNLRIINNIDLYLPVPEKLQGSMRYSLFADIGNVYYQGNSGLFDNGLTSLNGFNASRPSEFDENNFRASAGLSVEWLSPLGLIGLSYGYPLKEFADDRLERLQFNVSQAF